MQSYTKSGEKIGLDTDFTVMIIENDRVIESLA